MYCYVDLRYLVPPLINLFLFLLQESHGKPRDDHEPIFNSNFGFLSILILLFLLTSVNLPLTAQPIRVQPGDFSGPLAISLVASIYLSQPHFWVVYLFILCISPWYGLLINPIKRFLCWFCDTLRAIPILIISCRTQQRHREPEAAPQIEVEIVDMHGRYPLQDVQPNLEPVGVDVIDVHP